MWKQYDSDATLEALKKITRRDGRDDCFALLEAAKSKDTFLNHIRGISTQAGGRIIDGDDCPRFGKMSEAEFTNLNWTVGGETLWEQLKGMTPIEACRGGLWLYVTLHAIEKESIAPYFLASMGNGSGMEKIEEALASEDTMGSKGAPLYLELSRKILRTAFGAITERGEKAVFTDIPFARIWWQRHLAEDIAETVDLNADAIMDYFEKNRTIWELLTTKMASKLTVIADRPVRNGLISFLVAQVRKNGSKSEVKSVEFLIQKLGKLLAWRALGALTVEENSTIIGEINKSLNLQVSGGA